MIAGSVLVLGIGGWGVHFLADGGGAEGKAMAETHGDGSERAERKRSGERDVDAVARAVVRIDRWWDVKRPDMRRMERRQQVRETLAMLPLEKVKELLEAEDERLERGRDAGEEGPHEVPDMKHPWRAEIIYGLRERYGEQAPEEALAWSFGEDGGGTLFRLPLILGVARVDPERAMSVLRERMEEIDMTTGIDDDLIELTAVFTRHSRDEGFALVYELSDDAFPSGYEGYLAGLPAGWKPEDEVRRLDHPALVERFPFSGSFFKGLIALKWAEQDPTAAVAWLDGEGIDWMGATVQEKWLEVDPKGMAEWMKDCKLPEGITDRQRVIGQMAMVPPLRVEKLDALLPLVESPELRAEVFDGLVEIYARGLSDQDIGEVMKSRHVPDEAKRKVSQDWEALW